MKTHGLIWLLSGALMVSACAAEEAPEGDELAGESDLDGESLGKADHKDSTFTYYTIQKDYRKCLFPLCGGYHVARVNRAYTRCADGSWQEACYVSDIDWDAMGLLPEQVDSVRNSTKAVLLRGEITTKDYLGFPGMGQLVPSEAWIANNDNQAQGLFTKVVDSGIRCITTPCNTLKETKVNSRRNTILAELDFEWSDAADDEISKAFVNIGDGTGVLVAGYRYWFYDAGWHKGRLVTQFWRRILAPPAPSPVECVVGGCSSQVCSEAGGDPIVTTCEWRPEYACYQTATCEVQPNGQCGWTPTEELNTCLGI